jgi:hypothetical protein
MTNRFLFALMVLLSQAEATVPAGAFSVASKLFDVQPTDDSGAIIQVKKGKGHSDGEKRFEWHHRHGAYRFSRHRRHSHGIRGYHGNQEFNSGFGGGSQNQPNGQN